MKGLADLNNLISVNKPNIYISIDFSAESCNVNHKFIPINSYRYDNITKTVHQITFRSSSKENELCVWSHTVVPKSSHLDEIRLAIGRTLKNAVKTEETIDISLLQREFALTIYNYAIYISYGRQGHLLLLDSLSKAKILKTYTYGMTLYKINDENDVKDDNIDVKIDEKQEGIEEKHDENKQEIDEIARNYEEIPIENTEIQEQKQHNEDDYELPSDCIFDISEAVSYENINNIKLNIDYTNSSIFTTNIQRSNSKIQTIPPLHFDMSSQSYSPTLTQSETQYEMHPLVYNSEYIFSKDNKLYSDMEAQTPHPDLSITPLPESELHIFSLESYSSDYSDEYISSDTSDEEDFYSTYYSDSSEDVSEKAMQDLSLESDPDSHRCTPFKRVWNCIKKYIFS